MEHSWIRIVRGEFRLGKQSFQRHLWKVWSRLPMLERSPVRTIFRSVWDPFRLSESQDPWVKNLCLHTRIENNIPKIKDTDLRTWLLAVLGSPTIQTLMSPRRFVRSIVTLGTPPNSMSRTPRFTSSLPVNRAIKLWKKYLNTIA